MGASVVAAIAASNVVNAQNAGRIYAEETARCRGVIDAFHSEGATIQQMQEYAYCVNRVFPAHSNVFAFKIAFAVALVGMIAGFIQAWRESGGMQEYLVYGLLGFVLFPCAGTILCGIYWLFT